MASHYLRKYGVQTTIDFELYETDGTDLKTDAVHVAGDTNIMKDEAAEAATTNAFVDEGQGYSITLTATEMQAARIVVYVVDQGTKAWLDKVLVIETYGNASAEHAFDLDTATVNLSSTTETQIDAIETDTNEIQGKLPTNKIMGSSVVTDKDDEIDAIKVYLESGGAIYDFVDEVESLLKNATYGLSALRTRGDAAWITATGFSTHAAADVWAVGTRALTDKADFSLSAAGIDAIIDDVIEGTLTLRQAVRVFLSALAGKSAGGGTNTITFRDNADAKDRISATVDVDGNRTAVTLDGS